jgi:predicted secreted Zn-dependent protease
VDVPIPRRLAPFISALFAAVFVLAVACGGDGATPPAPTQGGTQTSTQLDGAQRIELFTTLETLYYDVEGLTTEAIFNYIERHGPTDGEGKRGSGLTSVVWGYEWQGGPASSRCSIRSMTIRADMQVTLPRHANEAALSPSIRRNWQNYAESVAVHEQTHVDIYEEGASELKARMEAIGPQDSCDKLEAEIKRTWSEQQNRINARQAAFHNDEFDRLARQRAPLAAKIDLNRSEINALQREIDGLQRTIGGLARDIERIAAEIAAVDSQIRAVNESSLSPQDKQAQLLVLVQQRNALQGRHNEAVDEHNSAIDDWQDGVARRDALINETNQLVELFNWTR